MEAILRTGIQYNQVLPNRGGYSNINPETVISEKNDSTFIKNNAQIYNRGNEFVADTTTGTFNQLMITLNLLYCTYRITDTEIVKFVHDNNLLDILTEAPKYIARYFDEFDVKIELYEDTDKVLLFSIMTNLSTKEAFTQLRSLFKEWKTLSNFEKTKHINITTEVQ